MKRYIIIVCLSLVCLCSWSQTVVTPQATLQSLEDLETRQKVGNLVFGDSITHYLRDLELIKTESGGVVKAALSECDKGLFRIGESRPAVSVFVTSKGYRIFNVSAFYDNMDEEKIRKHLRTIFGVATDYDGNAQTWQGKRFVVVASRVDGVFAVSFTYLGL